MQHKGEIVENAVRESAYPISKLAQKLGKSRRWMYLMFDNPNVSIDHILQIGKIIHYDFYTEISELKSTARAFADIQTTYDVNENDPIYWKNKYFNLLEDYHLLLKKHQDE